jgi:hypothetical protein
MGGLNLSLAMDLLPFSSTGGRGDGLQLARGASAKRDRRFQISDLKYDAPSKLVCLSQQP